MSYEPNLSLEAMRRLCRRAGAKRVGRSAAMELARILDEVGVELAREAIGHAMHAGRRTVRAKDIKAAYEKMYRSKRSYHIRI